MEPDIKTGSLILVEKFNSNEIFSKIHVGDDITYKVGNDTVITHRIMEINEDSDQIITKGIKNNNTGETINSSMVVGKVFLVIPFVGYIFNYYVILLLILGIIFVYIGVNLRKELVKN
jgi:signal peptidase